MTRWDGSSLRNFLLKLDPWHSRGALETAFKLDLSPPIPASLPYRFFANRNLPINANLWYRKDRNCEENRAHPRSDLRLPTFSNRFNSHVRVGRNGEGSFSLSTSKHTHDNRASCMGCTAYGSCNTNKRFNSNYVFIWSMEDGHTRGKHEAVSRGHSRERERKRDRPFERRLMTVNFYLSSPWTGISPPWPVHASRMSRTKAPIQDSGAGKGSRAECALPLRTRLGSVNILMSHYLQSPTEPVNLLLAISPTIFWETKTSW